LDGRRIQYEIIILNDASCDSSLNIMKDLSGQSPNVRYLHFPRRQGLGNMMKKGYELATKEWIAMVSADGQFEPEHFNCYLKYVDTFDIIAGNRVDRCKFYSLSRIIVSKVLNYIARYIFRIPIHDVGWTKIVKKNVLRKINLKRTGAIVELELVVKSILYRFSIHEVAVPYAPRYSGRSKCFNLRILILSSISLVALYFEVVWIIFKRWQKNI